MHVSRCRRRGLCKVGKARIFTFGAAAAERERGIIVALRLELVARPLSRASSNLPETVAPPLLCDDTHVRRNICRLIRRYAQLQTAL